MNVYSCGVNEGLMIGDNLQVTVLEIKNDEVRIGITSSDGEERYWEETLYLGQKEEPCDSWQIDSQLELQLN